MVSKKIVKDVLKRTLALDFKEGRKCKIPDGDQDSVISMLIHDVFGGEILKTHKSSGWHFYNRINGKRLDFSGTETRTSFEGQRPEDIPSTPDETSNYFDKTDYSTFFMRFVITFEETVRSGRVRFDHSTRSFAWS